MRTDGPPEKWDMEGPVLLDTSGAVGKAYGAKTTPQIVVIDAQGMVRFNGALDNAPLGGQPGRIQALCRGPPSQRF